MSWPIKPLGEVATLQRGFDLPTQNRLDGSIPIYAANGRVGFHNEVRVAGPGVVTGRSGSIGKVHYVQGGYWPLNTALYVKDFHGNDPKYIYWLLRELRLERFHHGTGVPTLNRNVVHLERVPVPPLPEQRRIAAILDKADALRAKRREAIAKLDQLLQSVFLEMFGDPVTNPKGWPILGIADLAQQLRDGPFGSNLKSEHYRPHGVRVVRLQNIGVWEFLDSDAAYISEEHFASLPRNHCFPGDVLIGTLGDPNLRACVLPARISRALNKADCLLFRPNPSIAMAEYVCGLMNCRSLIESAAGLALGQTRLRISMGRLKELMVPVPPLFAQSAFAKFCLRFEKQKAALLTNAAAIEVMFSSTQTRAFAGTL